MISFARRALRGLAESMPAFRRRPTSEQPARECIYADGKDYGPCDDGPVEEYRFVDGLGFAASKSMDMCWYHAFRASNGEM
jgi:hypothetical protein